MARIPLRILHMLNVTDLFLLAISQKKKYIPRYIDEMGSEQLFRTLRHDGDIGIDTIGFSRFTTFLSYPLGFLSNLRLCRISIGQNCEYS